MRVLALKLCACIALLARADAQAAASAICEAEGAKLDAARVEVVVREAFGGGKGVALKAGVAARSNDVADLAFSVRVPRAGRYSLGTYAAVDAAGAEQMRRARSKHESLVATFQVGGQRPTKRVVFVPWGDTKLCWQHIGVFAVSGTQEEVRVWLPSGVLLDRVEVSPYRPPAVPPVVASYTPSVTPPTRHPRLSASGGSERLLAVERGKNVLMFEARGGTVRLARASETK